MNYEEDGFDDEGFDEDFTEEDKSKNAIAEAASVGAGGSESKKSAELAVDYLIKVQNVKGGAKWKA